MSFFHTFSSLAGYLLALSLSVKTSVANFLTTSSPRLPRGELHVVTLPGHGSAIAKQAYTQTLRSVIESSIQQKDATCTPQTLRKRRNYSHLSRSAKEHYISSILCLMSLPPLTPPHLSSGARCRYDDFVVTHINQTTEIHYTASFNCWHRYFILAFELALREECGFTGDLPYWDHAETARTELLSHPLFDGSSTSLSGNGAYIGEKKHIMLGKADHLTVIDLPTSSGGGCVTSGPFVNMSVNLGPGYPRRSSRKGTYGESAGLQSQMFETGFGGLG